METHEVVLGLHGWPLWLEMAGGSNSLLQEHTELPYLHLYRGGRLRVRMVSSVTGIERRMWRTVSLSQREFFPLRPL